MRRRTAEHFIVGSIGGVGGVAMMALLGLFIPWIHMTWGFAAVAIPFNSALATLYSARKSSTAERLRLPPAIVRAP